MRHSVQWFVLALAVAAVVVSAASARSMRESRATAGVNVYSAPNWFPLRHGSNGGAFKVGCINTNCSGPYHGYWAADLLDPAGAPGAPVYAAGAGQVKNAVGSFSACGGSGTPGNFVAIYHGNNETSFYYHLKTVSVNVGDWVDENTQIGTVGSVGFTVPCPAYHLHFEVDAGNLTNINSAAALNAGTLNACHGGALVQYSESTWNSVPAESTTAYSDGTSCRYVGHIVKWTDGTSWLVGADLRRRWIHDARTYYCLVNRGMSDVGVQSSTTLDSLPLSAQWAECPPGDVNTDGTVGIVDLSILLSHYGQGGDISSDLNFDGTVNILDLSILLSNYNTSS